MDEARQDWISEHGRVKPWPDGIVARCFGPPLCPVCRAEQGRLEAERLDAATGESFPGFPAGEGERASLPG